MRPDSRVDWIVLAFFDPLLARAGLVVEGDDALGRLRQFAEYEADARVALPPHDIRPWPRPARLVQAPPLAGQAA
jgi:hypothetical protein